MPKIRKVFNRDPNKDTPLSMRSDKVYPLKFEKVSNNLGFSRGDWGSPGSKRKFSTETGNKSSEE